MTSENNSPVIIKRFLLIIQLIELEETEGINEQVNRLLREDLDDTAIGIIELLKAGHYQEAVLGINEIINNSSGITLYQNPEIGALKLEINQLENQVITTESEVVDVEQLISAFNHQMHIRLGTKIAELYKLKYAISERKRDKNDEAQQQFEETSKQYEEFKKDFAEQEKKEIFELTPVEKDEIIKLFKAARLLCHPDKFSDATPEEKRQCENIFTELYKAWEKQDFSTIKLIYEKLKNGILNFNIKANDNIELLKIRAQELRQKLNDLIAKLADYRESEAMKILNQYDDISIYFDELNSSLEAEIENLKAELIANE